MSDDKENKKAVFTTTKNKKKIKKESVEHRTLANPPQKPTHKAQRGGYAGVQPFHEIKKKHPFFD